MTAMPSSERASQHLETQAPAGTRAPAANNSLPMVMGIAVFGLSVAALAIVLSQRKKPSVTPPKPREVFDIDAALAGLDRQERELRLAEIATSAGLDDDTRARAQEQLGTLREAARADQARELAALAEALERQAAVGEGVAAQRRLQALIASPPGNLRGPAVEAKLRAAFETGLATWLSSRSQAIRRAINEQRFDAAEAALERLTPPDLAALPGVESTYNGLTARLQRARARHAPPSSATASSSSAPASSAASASASGPFRTIKPLVGWTGAPVGALASAGGVFYVARGNGLAIHRIDKPEVELLPALSSTEPILDLAVPEHREFLVARTQSGLWSFHSKLKGWAPLGIRLGGGAKPTRVTVGINDRVIIGFSNGETVILPPKMGLIQRPGGGVSPSWEGAAPSPTQLPGGVTSMAGRRDGMLIVSDGSQLRALQVLLQPRVGARPLWQGQVSGCQHILISDALVFFSGRKSISVFRRADGASVTVMTPKTPHNHKIAHEPTLGLYVINTAKGIELLQQAGPRLGIVGAFAIGPVDHVVFCKGKLVIAKSDGQVVVLQLER